ncbi:histidine kinase [Nitrosomonadales bacterium]|jgi:two-component system sensor histidine kinase UhpB|nr:histidine kinase [Methylophilaceae bacterium]MDA9635753.1 histidine kinase [Nitrosomonadales bacterium]
MSLKSQLLIYINSLLLIATLIGLMTIMMVTQKNVREEVLSTMSLAEFAIEQGVKKNPDFYLFQRNNNELGISELSGIRHLKIQFFDLNDALLEETLNTPDEIKPPPTWFINIIESLSDKIFFSKINIEQRGELTGYILIKPEPIYEYSEIWQQIKVGLWIIGSFLVLINFVVLLLFSHMIKPINKIIEGFEKLEAGNFKSKIRKSNILELDIIGKKFNSMIDNLRKSNNKIHKLSQNLIDVQEQEKSELARDLHDELGQSLTALQAEAASISKTTKKKSRDEAIFNVIKLSKNMMLSTREIIKKLNLGLIEDLGFESALIELFENWKRRFKGVTFEYSIDKKAIKKITKKRAAHLYRIFQEALTNIAKHSSPKKIQISIKYTDNIDRTKILISNDGFSNDTSNQDGLGLIGIAERVDQIKGTLEISKKKLFKIIINLSN